MEAQDEYRKMMQERWAEAARFREDRMREVREMREQRRKLLEESKFMEAFDVEDKIADALDDADFIPRTTIQ